MLSDDIRTIVRYRPGREAGVGAGGDDHHYRQQHRYLPQDGIPSPDGSSEVSPRRLVATASRSAARSAVGGGGGEGRSTTAAAGDDGSVGRADRPTSPVWQMRRGAGQGDTTANRHGIRQSDVATAAGTFAREPGGYDRQRDGQAVTMWSNDSDTG